MTEMLAVVCVGTAGTGVDGNIVVLPCELRAVVYYRERIRERERMREICIPA